MGACTAGLRGCCGHDARVGELEFGDLSIDPNSRLTLTDKFLNNNALVKHIKTTASQIALVINEDLIVKS